MSKEIILKTALNLFANFGIKGVSMSQIADSLRISKKTLYVYFKSKEELLCACLDVEYNNTHEMLKGIEKRAEDPIESIVMLALNFNQYRSFFCPAFYKEIPHFYHANRKLDAIHDLMQQEFIRYFKRGVEEGLFQPESNYEVIISVFTEQILLANENQSKISHPSHKGILFLTFLRGVSTEKGHLMLERLLPKEEEKYMYEY